MSNEDFGVKIPSPNVNQCQPFGYVGSGGVSINVNSLVLKKIAIVFTWYHLGTNYKVKNPDKYFPSIVTNPVLIEPMIHPLGQWYQVALQIVRLNTKKRRLAIIGPFLDMFLYAT